MRRIILFISLVALTACVRFSTPEIVIPPTTPPSTQNPAVTETPSPESVNCAYMWANKELPEVTQQVNQAFLDAGMSEVDARASAYGEDCINTETNSVVRFLEKQTDFFIRIAVPNLEDTQSLGEWAEKVMRVLNAFQPGVVPGPNPGYIGITFEAGETNLNLWFERTKGEKLLEQGARGASLFDALRNP